MTRPYSDDANATLEALLASFARINGGMAPTLFPQVLVDVVSMFSGEYLDYQKNDTPYHDLAHTLAVSQAFMEIVEGYQEAQRAPGLTPREIELGVAASLLHDTGYLKLRSDQGGTGAKYTFTHVLRSCAVASSYLPPLGVSLDELDEVLGAIRCTNTGTDASNLNFRTRSGRVIGLAVATADYVGQMAAPNYVEALPKLFAEFEESDNYAGVPIHRRQFRSAAELVFHTPDFWRHSVRPKLDQELEGFYRFLARPTPHGPNLRLDAIEANIARIERNRQG